MAVTKPAPAKEEKKKKRTKTIDELNDEEKAARRLGKMMSARRCRARDRKKAEKLKEEAKRLEKEEKKKADELIAAEALEDEDRREVERARNSRDEEIPDITNALLLVVIVFGIDVQQFQMFKCYHWTKAFQRHIIEQLENDWKHTVWWNLGKRNAIRHLTKYWPSMVNHQLNLKRDLKLGRDYIRKDYPDIHVD